MKITKRELKQMINESVREVLNEHGRGARLLDRTDDRFVDPLEVKSDARKEYFEEKRMNRIKNTLTKMCNVFAKKNGLDNGYVSYCSENGYDWEMVFRIKYKEGRLSKNVLNALHHSNLRIKSDFSYGYNIETFFICGYFDNESIEELENIINRL